MWGSVAVWLPVAAVAITGPRSRPGEGRIGERRRVRRRPGPMARPARRSGWVISRPCPWPCDDHALWATRADAPDGRADPSWSARCRCASCGRAESRAREATEPPHGRWPVAVVGARAPEVIGAPAVSAAPPCREPAGAAAAAPRPRLLASAATPTRRAGKAPAPAAITFRPRRREPAVATLFRHAVPRGRWSGQCLPQLAGTARGFCVGGSGVSAAVRAADPAAAPLVRPAVTPSCRGSSRAPAPVRPRRHVAVARERQPAFAVFVALLLSRFGPAAASRLWFVALSRA